MTGDHYGNIRQDLTDVFARQTVAASNNEADGFGVQHDTHLAEEE